MRGVLGMSRERTGKFVSSRMYMESREDQVEVGVRFQEWYSAASCVKTPGKIIMES